MENVGKNVGTCRNNRPGKLGDVKCPDSCTRSSPSLANAKSCKKIDRNFAELRATPLLLQSVGSCAELQPVAML